MTSIAGEKEIDRLMKEISPSLTVQYRKSFYRGYTPDQVDKLLKKAINYGREQAANEIIETRRKIHVLQEALTEVTALVEPLPRDPEGHSLTLGMDVWCEGQAGLVKGVIGDLGVTGVYVKFGVRSGWMQPKHVHRDKPTVMQAPAMDLAELRNKSGRSCDNVARIIRLPNSYRHIEIGAEVFGADAIKALATLYDCDKSEVESAAAETRRRKASGLYD